MHSSESVQQLEMGNCELLFVIRSDMVDVGVLLIQIDNARVHTYSPWLHGDISLEVRSVPNRLKRLFGHISGLAQSAQFCAEHTYMRGLQCGFDPGHVC